MRSAVWTVRSVDEAFFASDTIIGYNAFGKNHCTQHRIDYDTLYSHVLRKIRECARAALMDGEAVADRLTNTCEAEQREQREAMERSLTRDEERIEVLDKMVMRLYEDMRKSVFLSLLSAA